MGDFEPEKKLKVDEETLVDQPQQDSEAQQKRLEQSRKDHKARLKDES